MNEAVNELIAVLSAVRETAAPGSSAQWVQYLITTTTNPADCGENRRLVAQDTTVPDGDVVIGFLDCRGGGLAGDVWFVAEDGVVECFGDANPLSITGLLEADDRGDRQVFASVREVQKDLISLLPS